MRLQVAKWGNSLALRIPADTVRRLGLREGATVEAQFSVDGTPVDPASAVGPQGFRGNWPRPATPCP